MEKQNDGKKNASLELITKMFTAFLKSNNPSGTQALIDHKQKPKRIFRRLKNVKSSEHEDLIQEAIYESPKSFESCLRKTCKQKNWDNPSQLVVYTQNNTASTLLILVNSY